MSSLQLSGGVISHPQIAASVRTWGVEVACQLHSQLQNGEEMELLVALTSLL